MRNHTTLHENRLWRSVVRRRSSFVVRRSSFVVRRLSHLIPLGCAGPGANEGNRDGLVMLRTLNEAWT